MSETGQAIIKAVREAAMRNPLNIHQARCRYVAAGAPSCLVGHALWDLGLIDHTLEASLINDEGVDAALPLLGIDVDHDEVVWLEIAQTAQDTKHTWQDAVRVADEFDPTDAW